MRLHFLRNSSSLKATLVATTLWLVAGGGVPADPDKNATNGMGLGKEGSVKSEVTLGLSRGGRPRSITVDLTSNEDKVADATVVLHESHNPAREHTAELVEKLGAGAKKTEDIFSPLPMYSVGVEYRFNSQVVANATLNVEYVADTDAWVSVLAPGGSEFSYLSGYPNLTGRWKDTRVSRVAPKRIAAGQLPTYWASYLGPDLLIVQDCVGLRLSNDVQKALLDWTAAGGCLAFVSHGEADEFQSTSFAPNLPLTKLQRSNGTTLTGQLQPGAKVVHGTPAEPLVTIRPYGQGRIVLVGTNVATQKQLGEENSKKLWQKVMQEVTANPFADNRFRKNEGDLLDHPKELPKPSVALLAWYLVGYVLVLVPLNYWVLRRRDRMIWLIVTLPATSVVVTFLSFAINRGQRGNEMALHELGLSYIRPGESQVVGDHIAMLFSPREERIRFVVPPNCYFRPPELDHTGYTQRQLHWFHKDGEMGYRDYPLSTWSVQRFRNLSVSPLAGTVTAEWSGEKLTVHNNSGINLEDACVVVNGRTFGHFSVPSGSSPVSCQDWSKSGELRTFMADWATSKNQTSEDGNRLADRIITDKFCGIVAYSSNLKLSFAPKIAASHHHYIDSMVLIPLDDLGSSKELRDAKKAHSGMPGTLATPVLNVP